jgi:hypothetical protein
VLDIRHRSAAYRRRRTQDRPPGDPAAAEQDGPSPLNTRPSTGRSPFTASRWRPRHGGLNARQRRSPARQ